MVKLDKLGENPTKLRKITQNYGKYSFLGGNSGKLRNFREKSRKISQITGFFGYFGPYFAVFKENP